MKRLCADLDPAEMRGRVILIPQLSETACVANLRVSPEGSRVHEQSLSVQSALDDLLSNSNFVKTRTGPQVQVVLDIHSGWK